MTSQNRMLMILRVIVLAAVLSAVIIACGGQTFTGSPSTKQAAPGSEDLAKNQAQAGTDAADSSLHPGAAASAAADQKQTTPAQGGSPVAASSVLGSSPDERKLLSCIAQWGDNQFTAAQLQGYKTLTSNAQGFSSAQIVDSKKTDEPRLVLVKVTTAGFNAAELQLLNPNGYYCLDTDQTGFGSLRIIQTCQAEVASDEAKATGFVSQNTTLVGCQ